MPSYWVAPVAALVSQSCGLPERHCWQCPQFEMNERMQRSPGLTLVTLGPTASTVPAPSWPNTHGSGTTAVPWMTC